MLVYIVVECGFITGVCIAENDKKYKPYRWRQQIGANVLQLTEVAACKNF